MWKTFIECFLCFNIPVVPVPKYIQFCLSFRCQASIMQIYQRDVIKEIFVKTHEAAKISKGESGASSSSSSVAATTAEFVMLVTTVVLLV